MPTLPTPLNNTRLGFHYFPDLDHYTDRDLRTWLPKLHDLGGSWITLIAPPDRAIPEPFLRGLLAENIEPVLHFPLSFESFPTARDLAFLFDNYSRWGVHYVVLFDRPNSRLVWPTSSWAQTHLVERFLDHYIPLAEIALHTGLIPVFPPLEPGGDYWDTAFLRAALESLQRRGQPKLIDNLVIGVYALAGERPLNWGSGGPERWPNVRPYYTPSGEEDQLGFHIFDWYLAISKAVLGTASPLLLFKSGSRPIKNQMAGFNNMDSNTHVLRNLAIAKSLIGSTQPKKLSYLDKSTLGALAPIPSQVLGCHFWLLSSSSQSIQLPHAWYKPNGDKLAIVDALHNWNTKRKLAGERPAEYDMGDGMSIAPNSFNQMASPKTPDVHPIDPRWFENETTFPPAFFKQAMVQPI
jgi:hypothetical protein